MEPTTTTTLPADSAGAALCACDAPIEDPDEERCADCRAQSYEPPLDDSRFPLFPGAGF